MSQNLKIFIDGASIGNPGPAGIGIAIYDSTGNIIKKLFKHIGDGTNNFAEYMALVYALQEALMMKAKSVEIRTDSELLAKQISGEYRVKDQNLKVFYGLATNLFKAFDDIKVIHIDRGQNKMADSLAAKAIETRFDMSLKEE